MENSNENQHVQALVLSSGEVKQTSLTIPANFNWEAVNNAPKGVNLAPSYLEFNSPGESVRCMYIGMSEILTKEKTLPVALIATENGIFMLGAMQIVGVLEKLPIGAFVEIQYVGEEKTGTGNKMKVFNAFLLQVA